MKTETHTYFNQTTDTKFTLELSDFDYLKEEFTITQGNIGFDLVSKKDKKLSIHIGTYDIKYDRDISELRLFLAKERISIPKRLHYNIGEKAENFKQFLPKTSEALEMLICEFKNKGTGNVSENDVITFLLKD